MTILTRIWSVQHPNAGRNIQLMILLFLQKKADSIEFWTLVRALFVRHPTSVQFQFKIFIYALITEYIQHLLLIGETKKTQKCKV